MTNRRSVRQFPHNVVGDQRLPLLGVTHKRLEVSFQRIRGGRHTRPASRLFHELHVARGDGSYTRVLARLAKTDLLVLDLW
jgi:hypothetical protein